MRRMTGLLLLLIFCLVPAVLVMSETISECALAHMDEPEWLPMEATDITRLRIQEEMN